MPNSAIAKCFSVVFLVICFVFGQYEAHSQNNQNSNNNQQTQTNQNVTITHPVKVVVEPDQEQIETEKGYKARQEKRDETNATWNKTGILINSLLFILVLIQAFISYRSLGKMQKQADTMDKQADLMEKQLATMTDQTKTMEDQTKAMELQLATMVTQTETMQQQTVAMQETLEETRKGIRENNYSVQIANRAYVNVNSVNLRKVVKSGERTVAVVGIVNKGNTPAVKLKSHGNLQFLDKIVKESLPPLPFEDDGYESSWIIPKDGNVFLEIVSHLPVATEIAEAFEQKKVVLYVWGVIEYEDIFQKTHKTHYCFLHKFGDGTELNIYSIGNSVD